MTLSEHGCPGEMRCALTMAPNDACRVRWGGPERGVAEVASKGTHKGGRMVGSGERAWEDAPMGGPHG
jgi:hypothetical protein